MTCSPLLHLRRWGCHEMGRCIHRQNFLGKSNMSNVEKKAQTEMYAAQLQMFANFICIFLHITLTMCTMQREKTSTHTNTKEKRGACLLKNTLYSWVFGLPRSSMVKLMSVVVIV